MKRCTWTSNDLNIAYHDVEWGVPLHDEHRLFEFLILEGAQAGLSWDTILRKREAYREAFAAFDPAKVARFSDAKLEKLMTNDGIIRNRLKIASAVLNAKAFLAVQKELGSFDRYVWSFVGHKPVVNKRRGGDVPATTPLSDSLSKDLRRRGFNFVGSTIIYAFMQATGIVNDHLMGCFRYKELLAAGDAD